MIIYLDESGDLGFDFDNKKNSSKYFVITILITRDFSVIKRAVRRTLDNKINHRKKKRLVNELKGSATNFTIKKYFYSLLQNSDDWYLNTIILDKKHLLKNCQLIIDKGDLYNLLAKTVLEEIEILNHVDVIQLHIDRSKTTKEIAIFDACIKSSRNFSRSSTLNIEHLSSEKNMGLQAVDMFCYGIAKKYEYKDESWYDLFKDKIKREIIYRP